MTIKILHLTYDMAIGGTEQVIRQLVENTNPETFDVSILCLENRIGDMGQELIKQGVNIQCLNRQEGFDIKLIKSIRTYVIKHNIDILHCHQYTPYSYGILASIFTHTKVIFTEHGRFYPDVSSWKRKLINPFLALITDKITSISEATKQALVHYESLPENKIQVIYNGVIDLSDRIYDNKALQKKHNISADHLVLGTISRLDPIKNHQMMLEAFSKIHQQYPYVKLLIVGDGELRETLEELCDKLAITEQVIFTGFIIEPQKYLNIMDIFLLPSLSEGTSMTLLEAMSFSKPCIVTNVGGNPEIVSHNKTGLVVPNEDCSALVKACVSLINDSDRRQQLAIAGRQRYEQLFSVDMMMRQFESLYVSLSKND